MTRKRKELREVTEIGEQVGFTPNGKIFRKRVAIIGKGVPTQISLDDYKKLIEARLKKSNPNNNDKGMLELELANFDLRIEGLKEYLETEKARKLVPIIKRTGWYKGEVGNLTITEYRLLTGAKYRTQIAKVNGKTIKRKVLVGGEMPKASIRTPDGKYIRWEYALDKLATEMKYPSDEALKKAIEDTGRRLHELEELEAGKRYLEEEIKAMPKPKEKIERKIGFAFTKKRVAVNGKVTAYQVTAGKDTVGYIVAFPPTYGVYPSANGLSLSISPLGGAKSVKKAKEIAKTELRK